MQISDLVEGQSIKSLPVLVVEKTVATTARGKQYCKLKVRDSSGEVGGNAWDFNDKGPSFHQFGVGSVIEITASVETYNGNLQISVRGTAASDAPIEHFGRKTRFDVEEMWGKVADIVASFNEPLTKFVAEELLLNNEAVKRMYQKAPAAKGVHNAWYGGLLEHVWSLCTIAEPLIQHYKSRYQPSLSRDKVLFGLIFHDAGKMMEYDANNPAFPITPIGLLTNHIVLGPAWVYEKANKYMDRWLSAPFGTGEDFKMERAQLMHVLAAHHGKHDWGSPVVPHTLEAVLVHHLDNLDSKMMHAVELVEGPEGPAAGFSQRSYFEKASFYQYNKQEGAR